MNNTSKVLKLYTCLKNTYGHPAGQWSLWCKRPKTLKEKEEIIIGSILTQQANWNNVIMAIKNLKKARLLSLNSIYNKFVISKDSLQNTNSLQELIRPSGFYNQKTQYLLNITRFIIEEYKTAREMQKAPSLEIREKLLKIKGIGQETADSILLYALEKEFFVIDEYTKRFCKKNNLTDKFSYSHLQQLFEFNLPQDHKLYQDYHALIVIDGKSSS